jgi:hypothetical protein
VSGRDAHGVEVGVVVAEDETELPLLDPAGAPAPVETVGGGGAGAGVTFGVGRGTESET